MNRILLVLNKPIKPGELRWTFKKHRKVICGWELGFNIPSGSSHEEAEKYLPALVATVGHDIELLKYKGLLVVRIIEKDFPKVMKAILKDLLPDKVLIGYNRMLEPVYHPLNVHMLVAGAARSGKTDALRWFVYQFILQKYDVYICDMKEISFYPFEGLVTVAKSLAASCKVLEDGVAELNRRKKLIDFNRNRDLKDTFQPRVIVIDEAAALAPSQYKDKEQKDLAWRCDNAIGLLGMQAREFKIFVIYATQRPDMSIINKLFKATVEAKIAFRTSTGTNSQIIIDRTGAEDISPSTPGRCIYNYDQDYLLQVPYVGNDSAWNRLLLPLKTEVIQDGNSKRNDTQRKVIEGSFTSPNRNESPDGKTVHEPKSWEESQREFNRIRKGEVDGKFLALPPENPSFNNQRFEDDEWI